MYTQYKKYTFDVFDVFKRFFFFGLEQTLKLKCMVLLQKFSKVRNGFRNSGNMVKALTLMFKSFKS